MEITLSVTNWEQLQEALFTPVRYIRFGEPHCGKRAEAQWPEQRLREAVAAICKMEKVPQLQLLLPSAASREYWKMTMELLREFPRTEVVLGQWGALPFPLPNRKMASAHLNMYNSNQTELAWRWGAEVISLPLNLPVGQELSSLIANSPKGLAFEYHLWGPARVTYLWSCPAGGCRPDRCGQEQDEVLLTHPQAGPVRLVGNTLWSCEPVDNLAAGMWLAEMGISRGLLQLSYGELEIAKTVRRCLQKIESGISAPNRTSYNLVA